MGVFSHRRPFVEVHPEQKWDYITLNDFKSTSCFMPFAYAYLWFSLFLSVAVYAVDIFTAVQLLAFNKWSSQIEPSQLIPFDVSKWVFSICIILSAINLVYEHIRAQRVMRRGSVAESFLDSLAARLESIRVGSGRGWRRFLVFAELTKSKKGAEYVALFTYFNFQSWIRVLICSGPRQVINAFTLYSVYDASLKMQGDNFESSIMDFFDKFKKMTEGPGGTQQTVILSGMVFTLVIWIFSFLSLLLAGIFFVSFLWYYIPRADGGLTGFCERKVNKRLKQIVSQKINKAMAEDERKRKKAEIKASKKTGEERPQTMLPTLPNVGGDKLPEMPMISRQDTMTTLPAYTSRPGTPGGYDPELKRPAPTRTGTMASSKSQYSTSQVSLLGAAAAPGTNSRSESPQPPLPPLNLGDFPPPQRTTTVSSNRSYGQSPQLQRMPSNGTTLNSGYTASPATYSSETMTSLPAPVRSPVNNNANGYNSYNNYGGPRPNHGDSRPYPGPGMGRPPYDDYSNGRGSPAPSTANSYHNGPLSPQGMGPNGYPIRSATNPMPPRGPPRGPPQPFAPPQRTMTAPPDRPYHQATGSNSSLRGMGMQSRNPYQHQQQPYRHEEEEEDYVYNGYSNTINSQMSGGFPPRNPGGGSQPYPQRNMTDPYGQQQPQQSYPMRSMTSPVHELEHQQPTLPVIDMTPFSLDPVPQQPQPSTYPLRALTPTHELDSTQVPSQQHQEEPNSYPMRSMTAPLQAPRHQPTGSASGSSLRSLVVPGEPHPNSLQRVMTAPVHSGTRHQPAPSTSSLRSITSLRQQQLPPLIPAKEEEEDDWFGDAYGSTRNGEGSGTGAGNSNNTQYNNSGSSNNTNNGWDQDLERSGASGNAPPPRRF